MKLYSDRSDGGWWIAGFSREKELCKLKGPGLKKPNGKVLKVGRDASVCTLAARVLQHWPSGFNQPLPDEIEELLERELARCPGTTAPSAVHL